MPIVFRLEVPFRLSSLSTTVNDLILLMDDILSCPSQGMNNNSGICKVLTVMQDCTHQPLILIPRATAGARFQHIG